MDCKWEFRSYVSGDLDEVRRWYFGLEENVQWEIAVQLSYCAVDPIERWQERKEYKKLSSDLAELEELIFVYDDRESKRKRHFRILGYSAGPPPVFMMLVGFEKTRWEKDYEEFGQLAIARMQEVRANRKNSQTVRWLYDDQ